MQGNAQLEQQLRVVLEQLSWHQRPSTRHTRLPVGGVVGSGRGRVRRPWLALMLMPQCSLRLEEQCEHSQQRVRSATAARTSARAIERHLTKDTQRKRTCQPRRLGK
jgi:hypothetical protein